MCGEPKPLSAYTKNKAAKDGLHPYCRPCNNARSKRWREANPDQARDNGKWFARSHESRVKTIAHQRARKYGMTPEELAAFIAANPDCAICGNPGKHIDHCHTTGKVRGHLCQNCNVGIGHFKESQTLLAKAITYLRVS